jgi:hypothetical protein
MYSDLRWDRLEYMHNSSGEVSYKMVTCKNCEGDECVTLRYVVGMESRQHKMLGFGLVVVKLKVLLPVSE